MMSWLFADVADVAATSATSAITMTSALFGCPRLLEQDTPNGQSKHSKKTRPGFPCREFNQTPRRFPQLPVLRTRCSPGARPVSRALRMQNVERLKLGTVALGSGCSTPFTRSGSWFLDATSHRFPLALPLALSARTWLEDVDSVLLRLFLAALLRSPIA